MSVLRNTRLLFRLNNNIGLSCSSNMRSYSVFTCVNRRTLQENCFLPSRARPSTSTSRSSATARLQPGLPAACNLEVKNIRKNLVRLSHGNSRPWTDLSYEEMVALVQSGDIQLFDVREPEEVRETGMIDGAVNIPLADVSDSLIMHPAKFKTKYKVMKPHEDDLNIIFSCLGGVRSRNAMTIAHQLGYRKARHYAGGFEEWSSKQK